MKDIALKRGINLGGWMSQCDYSRERLDGFIREDDIEKIASWGMDHIRLPIDYNVIQNDDGSMKEEGLAFRGQGNVLLATVNERELEFILKGLDRLGD